MRLESRDPGLNCDCVRAPRFSPGTLHRIHSSTPSPSCGSSSLAAQQVVVLVVGGLLNVRGPGRLTTCTVYKEVVSGRRQEEPGQSNPPPCPPTPDPRPFPSCMSPAPLHIPEPPHRPRSRLFPFPQRSHSFATQLTTSRARRRVSGVLTISRHDGQQDTAESAALTTSRFLATRQPCFIVSFPFPVSFSLSGDDFFFLATTLE